MEALMLSLITQTRCNSYCYNHHYYRFINAPESALDRVLNSVNREDTWDQFTGGRYYSEQQTIHKISNPWVENISVGARESAKIIYKQMKLSGRITRIQVPEVYHKLSMEGSDLIGTIIIRHSGYDQNGRQINQNINSRYVDKSSVIQIQSRLRRNLSLKIHDVSARFL